MMEPNIFSFSRASEPSSYKRYKLKAIELATQEIVVDTRDHKFVARFPNIFQHYSNPPLTGDVAQNNAAYHNWVKTPLKWWQNQLNFATWCATAGCGVSTQHLSKEGLLGALYRFHVYYTIRRILSELNAPSPTDHAYVFYDSPYDKGAFERLCSEFKADPRTGWKQSVDPHWHGLGDYSQYMTPSGAYRARFLLTKGPFFDPRDALRHHVDISMAWTTFIPDAASGFTHPGVERINDSIRTFVWALLHAQAQTRAPIVGQGTAFDEQKQFLANIEDAIHSPVDLPTSIKRYEDTLRYARSEVNYAFGRGLYMAPGDMLLRVGHIAGYNNLILIASDKETLGLNDGLNHAAPPDTQNDTGEKGLHTPMTPPRRKGARAPHTAAQAPHTAARAPHTASRTAVASAVEHEEEKTALVVASVAAGLLMLWLLG